MNPMSLALTRTWVASRTRAIGSVEDAKSFVAANAATMTRKNRFDLMLGAMIAWIAMSLAGASLAHADPATTANSGGETNITNLVTRITNFVIAILAGLSIMMFVYAAILFVTSGGSQQMIDRAKETTKYVVVGVALAAGVFVLRNLVIDVIGGATGPDGKGTLERGNGTGGITPSK